MVHDKFDIEQLILESLFNLIPNHIVDPDVFMDYVKALLQDKEAFPGIKKHLRY